MAESDFRVRFRFRVRPCLNIQAARHALTVVGRTVTISSGSGEKPIRDCEWLEANATGFTNEEDARDYALRLKAACGAAAAATRIGLDGGVDPVTSSFSNAVKLAVQAQTGVQLRDSVHGVDVFEDSPQVRFMSMRANLVGLVDPSLFFRLIEPAHLHAVELPQQARDTVLLVNYALMRTDPVAQIVFAVSAVEALGQASWSCSQRELLDSLANHASSSTIGTDEERAEVAAAIRRAHKLSLRQGVKRLLDQLGLRSLGKHWDAMYEARSKLVHGLAPIPGVDYSQQANDTINLCGRILMTLVAREIPAVAEHIDVMYPAPS
jgi:hypothetical protein